MLINQKGEFMTQRRYPSMSQIEATTYVQKNVPHEQTAQRPSIQCRRAILLGYLESFPYSTDTPCAAIRPSFLEPQEVGVSRAYLTALEAA
jgi:hypothetical protein